MEKYKYDESNGLWYELQGDYYLPCLKLSEEKRQPIGIWGRRHHEYLRRNKRITLSSLRISGKLNSYLAAIDRQAEKMFERLVMQMAVTENVIGNYLTSDFADLPSVDADNIIDTEYDCTAAGKEENNAAKN